MEGCLCVHRKYYTISTNCLLNAWQFYDSMDYAVSALGIICSAMKIYFQTCEILGSGKFDADKNVSYKL